VVANLYDENYDLDLHEERDNEEADPSCITVPEFCPEHHDRPCEESLCYGKGEAQSESKLFPSSLKDLCMDKILAQLPFIADDILSALPTDLLTEFTQRYWQQRLSQYDIDPDQHPTFLSFRNHWNFRNQRPGPEISLFSVSNGDAAHFALGIPEFNVVRVWECQPVLRYRTSIIPQTEPIYWAVKFVAISPKGGRVAVGLQQHGIESFHVEIWGVSSAATNVDTFECWGCVDVPIYFHGAYHSQPDLHRYHPVRWVGEDTLFYFFDIQDEEA